MKAIVQLRSRRVVGEEAMALRGKKVTEGEVSILLNGDADVYKPDGDVLVMLRCGAISRAAHEQAYPAFDDLKNRTTDNRIGYSGLKAQVTVSADGVPSQNFRTRDETGKIVQVRSAIAGYFDRRGGRFPYCRATAFTASEVEKWQGMRPLILEAAELFRENGGHRYRAQLEMAQKTNPAFVIEGTPFTTLTVNHNVVSAAHKDKGDFKDGLGLITVSRRGSYKGSWLVFPEYGVAADLQDGDAIFFNSHDWHGVTPFRDAEEGYVRTSVVYYYREKMIECGTPEEEIANARRVRGAL